jgi:hypothetical protein
MPVNLTALAAAVDAIAAQAAATETVEGSAAQVINGFAAQIVAAVEADNTIDAANTAALASIVETVRGRFSASATKLGAAITANTPPPTPAPPSA